VEFFLFPTNRGWTRDFGPMFVRRMEPKPELAVTAFRFNAWAKYPDWKKDASIHERAAKTGPSAVPANAAWNTHRA
jgi:agmatine deiminase